MHFQPLDDFARSRHDVLLRQAATRRALRVRRNVPASPRLRLARAVRGVGYAALSLGDALARSR